MDPDSSKSLGPGEVTLQRSVEEVIEDFGLGHAQARTFLLTGLVPFAIGSQLALTSITTAAITEEFSLSDYEQTLLTTAVFAGMLTGGPLGGWLADTLGRRCPVVISIFLLATVGLLASLATCTPVLLLAQLAAGLALGLGLPGACALLSESSPKGWRYSLRAASDSLFDFGFAFAALMAAKQDPELQQLHWRRLLTWNAVLLGLLGLPVLLLLRETATFLAHTGAQARALEALAEMRSRNGAEHVSLACQLAPREWAAHDAGAQGITCKQFQTIFSRRFFYVTVTLCHAAFFLNIYYYGGMGLQLRVENAGSSGALSGHDMVMGGVFDIVALIVAGTAARHLPGVSVLTAAMVSAAATVWCFALAGSTGSRTSAFELVFQFGSLGYYWVPSMGFVAIYQLALEVFPTHAAATGLGAVVGAGRLGAILAPDLLVKFEITTGHWSYFCYFVALTCALGAGMVSTILGAEIETKELMSEARPLLAGHALHKDAADA